MSSREFGVSETSRSFDTCSDCQLQKSNGSCTYKAGQLRCGRCFHGLTQPNTIFLKDLPSNHAHSETHMEHFLGQENLTILEFVNPSNFHFLAVQIDQLSIVGDGDWNGGDTWFDGKNLPF